MVVVAAVFVGGDGAIGGGSVWTSHVEWQSDNLKELMTMWQVVASSGHHRRRSNQCLGLMMMLLLVDHTVVDEKRRIDHLATGRCHVVAVVVVCRWVEEQTLIEVARHCAAAAECSR